MSILFSCLLRVFLTRVEGALHLPYSTGQAAADLSAVRAENLVHAVTIARMRHCHAGILGPAAAPHELPDVAGVASDDLRGSPP